MLSTLVTVLLICVMLSIIVGFLVSAVHLHRRHLRTLHAQAQTTALVIPPALAALSGPLPRIQELTDPTSLHSSWFRRRRTILSSALLAMVLLTLFVQSGLANDALQELANGLGVNPSGHLASFDINTALPPIPFSATANVVRIDSAARDQYYTTYQWQVWSFSSCSGISMEMVINAYGHNYIAADFLQKEADLGVWNVYNGLTGGEQGIAETAAYFGFKALPNPPRTLQALIYTVNKGFPVIVGIPGHIMVVRGGDSNYIYVADSSPADRTVLTHGQFMNMWVGFSVVLVPR